MQIKSLRIQRQFAALALAGLLAAPLAAGTLGLATSDLEALSAAADRAWQAQQYDDAVNDYRKLASMGDKFAQYRLSLVHFQGLDGDADLVEAYAWAAVAAEFGQPRLEEHRAALWSALPVSRQQQAAEAAQQKMKRYSDRAVAERILVKARQDKLKAIGRGLLPDSFVAIQAACDDPNAPDTGIAIGAACSGIQDPTVDPAARIRLVRALQHTMQQRLDEGRVEFGEFRVYEEPVGDSADEGAGDQ